ncbi:MAG: tRNA uridine-5-carboxymethylaminomethyl(34) synthesis GTPase MnmE [Paludibacteraceae bacterium]|nr:tRNA uridine-5-carboxymethylaminomethyl(34) synthesis GTPase MnmE [Paludibacteraceae bacterium]
MTDTDTIIALSTPYGSGAIAVVRMSGKKAITLAEQLCGRTFTRQVHYCHVENLDDLVVTIYHAPHSFTGEDVVELSCHGSLYIQQELQRRLIVLGARSARAGEFTQRAFLNGKMDLMQAEAVADLIAAQTQAEAQLALTQLRGGISGELAILREHLLKLTSLLELELDFGDHEELEFADRGELEQLAVQIEKKLTSLTDSFQTGNAIKNGVPVAIVGKTNAGKSTLLNALVGEERAIVSDVHGTTRDTIEETLVIDGVLFRLIDTAGLRATTDTIESLGIERSRRAMEKAQIIIHVIDPTEEERLLLNEESSSKVITVYNKSDLKRVEGQLCISAKTGDIEALKTRLVEEAGALNVSGVVVSSMRHYEALCRALNAIRAVRQGMNDGLSGELLSEDLQECLNALGEITGQITSQEVLNNIFSKFCIGK